MIRLSLDQRAVAAFDILQARLAQVDLGQPVAIFDVTPRPLAVLAIPDFPAELDDSFLQAGAEFLEAGSERLQW